MKPINVVSLVLWFIAATALGFGVGNWSVTNGYRVPISGISLSVSIAVVCVVLVVLALPIYRYKRALKKLLEAKDAKAQRPVPVDPFYAVRVLLLAKASAIASALFIGWHAGVLVVLFSAPVVASEAVGPNLSAGITSVVLLICAFVVQGICRLPSDGQSKDGAVAA